MSIDTEINATKQHYQTYYKYILTQEDISRGYAEILMDPYRVCDIYRVDGGAREQILKKALRWTKKAETEEQVLNQIMAACQRQLGMLREDSRPIIRPPAPAAPQPPSAVSAQLPADR